MLTCSSQGNAAPLLEACAGDVPSRDGVADLDEPISSGGMSESRKYRPRAGRTSGIGSLSWKSCSLQQSCASG